MASINASTIGAGGVVTTADASGVLNLQSNGTTIASVSSSGVSVTGTISSSTGTVYPIVSGAAVASTSGTSIDFTGIPSWVKRITVMFSGVSTNGTSQPLIQIGSGSVQTSGYLAGSRESGSGAVYTTGFGMLSGAAVNLLYGQIVLTNISGNVWVATHNIYLNQTSAYSLTGGGSVSISGVLDRIRITTVNGTDTFDAGSINILYE